MKTLNVLFLNNFFYLRGGSERVMFEEMRLLKEAGHRVAVFTRAYPLNQSSPYERFFPPEMQRDRYTLSIDGLKTVREIFYSSTAREGLRRMVEVFTPDVVHAHNIYGGLSTAVLDAVKEAKVPVLMTLHDHKLICPSYLMVNRGNVCERCKGRRFHQAILARCHKDSILASAVYAAESYFSHSLKKYEVVKFFICPSRFLLDKHVEFGFDAERMVHIPNPVRLMNGGAEDRPGEHLLYFGRISREKGIMTLIEAYRRAGLDVPLLIAGDGPERRNLEGVVRRANLSRITFTGYLDSNTLAEALKSARAVIVPSECYENAPMAILESFSSGRPVIGANIGGIPEMVEHGVNGYLFEPSNVDDLREKLRALVSLPDGRLKEMGRSARLTVERSYSAERHYEALMKTYRRVLEGSPR